MKVTFSYTQIEGYDIQCNNLIKFSNHQNLNEIVKNISKALKDITIIEDFNITDKNFINIKLSNEYIYKFSKFEQKYLERTTQSVLIDYGGPNIGKALHVGHLRTLNIGRALYNINKFVGNNVISDIHLGDWGMPVAQILAFVEEKIYL